MPSTSRKYKTHLLFHLLHRKEASFYFEEVATMGAAGETVWRQVLRWREEGGHTVTDGGRWRQSRSSLLARNCELFIKTHRTIQAWALGRLLKAAGGALGGRWAPWCVPASLIHESQQLVCRLLVPQKVSAMSSLNNSAILLSFTYSLTKKIFIHWIRA